MSYQIFTRNWWRMEDGQRVPNPRARRYKLEVVDTEEDAQAICREGNVNRPKSWEKLSRKYEYTHL